MYSRNTPAARRDFLDNLTVTGNVSEAARLAGLSRAQVYRAARRSDAFRLDWAEAMEAALAELEGEARRRAVEGITRPLAYRGQLVRDWNNKVIERREYSDLLMAHLLEFDAWDRHREQRLLGDDARLGEIETPKPKAIAPPPLRLEPPREEPVAAELDPVTVDPTNGMRFIQAPCSGAD